MSLPAKSFSGSAPGAFTPFIRSQVHLALCWAEGRTCKQLLSERISREGLSASLQSLCPIMLSHMPLPQTLRCPEQWSTKGSMGRRQEMFVLWLAANIRFWFSAQRYLTEFGCLQGVGYSQHLPLHLRHPSLHPLSGFACRYYTGQTHSS